MTDTLTTSAPAKINLGLEIPGRRPDGYHEIRSVLAKVSLFDDLSVGRSWSGDHFALSGNLSIPDEENIVLRARDVYRAASGFTEAVNIGVTKRIPSAAGLGGASSDAASALRLLNDLRAGSLSSQELLVLAERLGSDVPFFLGSPIASVRGTGTEMTPLPDLAGWVVIASPDIQIPRKTATLYGLLTEADFSDGSRIDALEHCIQNGQDISSAQHLLMNAFQRALEALSPEAREFRVLLEAAGVESHLSGAGPSRYVLCRNEDDAHQIKVLVEAVAPVGTQVFAVAFVSSELNNFT